MLHVEAQKMAKRFIGEPGTAGHFMIAGPGWKGVVPKRITQTIHSETQFAVALYPSALSRKDRGLLAKRRPSVVLPAGKTGPMAWIETVIVTLIARNSRKMGVRLIIRALNYKFASPRDGDMEKMTNDVCGSLLPSRSGHILPSAKARRARRKLWGPWDSHLEVGTWHSTPVASSGPSVRSWLGESVWYESIRTAVRPI